MPVSVTPMVERIARVIAGQRLSVNGEGESTSAAVDVDIEWQDRLGEARAILKTMREPDQSMAAAGDSAVWEKMVTAAIGQSPDE